MSKAKIKQAAAAFPVPQSRDQAVEYIAEIGRRQRERDRIQAAMNDDLAEIRQKYETEALPHAQAIHELAQGVQTWCEANRADLTQGGKVKYASLASGEVKWRMRPPSVSIRKMKEVIKTLKKLCLTRFIRTKEEIDKEAVLADKEAVKGIKGISVSQVEDFVILPFETELEEIA